MPKLSTPRPGRVTFVICAKNTPDLLPRVALLFHRSAVNIGTLTMNRTESRRHMRIGLTVTTDEHQARRMEANLFKIVNVVSVELRRLPRKTAHFPWHCPCCGNDYHCGTRS